MKRLPWISGIVLAVAMLFVVSFTRTARADGPCFGSCGAALTWTVSYCQSIGCQVNTGNSFSCGTDANCVGGYNRVCQCTCMGHLCYTNVSGRIDPSCP